MAIDRAYRFAAIWAITFVTFRVSRRRREMYIGHARLCLFVCLSLAAFPHYCTDTDPGVTWGNGRGAT